MPEIREANRDQHKIHHMSDFRMQLRTYRYLMQRMSWMMPHGFLNPMQDGSLHTDVVLRYLPKYLKVATRNRREARRAPSSLPSDSLTTRHAVPVDSAQYWSQLLPDRTMALTFDDGPHPEGTPAVLEILHRHHAKAAFFLLGAATCQHPQLAVQAQRDGHAICYHGWKHEPESSAEGFSGFQEVDRCLQRVAGAPLLHRVIRYPYGYNQHWQPPAEGPPAIINVRWTVDSLDYMSFSLPTKLHRLMRILQKTPTHGHVVLMHDGGRGGRRTARLLNRLLNETAALGWRTVLLTDYLDLPRSSIKSDLTSELTV